MPTELAAGVATRAYRSLETLHSMIYFAPEAEEELTKVGLRPGRMCYFASRSAAMGRVTGGLTAATFYNFNPMLVARHIPRAWSLASTEDILAARLTAADRALHRLLGDDTTGPSIAEAAELARVATAGLSPDGRPLYAAHADLAWPDEPHLVLWHAITLLREYRGDGHIAALVTAQLSGLEALVTHVATGKGFTLAAAKATRGWSDDEWLAAETGLRERGLFDTDGLSPKGVALRNSVEADTDRLAAAPWGNLDDERIDRLVDIGQTLSRTASAAGAFPPGVFAYSR